MGDPAPRIYLFYGDDEFAMEAAFRQLTKRLGDSSAIAMNVSRFDAQGVSLAKLEEVCLSAPFLAPRRLVSLDHAEKVKGRQAWEEGFYRLLESLPETTALVLFEGHSLSRRRDEQDYRESSALFTWCSQHPEVTYIKSFPLKTGSQFTHWVVDRAQKLNGEINPQAAQMLAEFVDDDPFLADQELSKLLDFVNRSRPVSVEDVEKLTPLYGQSDIFDVVDALGIRDERRALRLLHQILKEQNPHFVFSMIVRQFRLLLEARYHLDRQQDPRQQMDLHPYVAGKITAQAGNFTFQELRTKYRQLLDLDVAVKRGEALLEVDLEGLIAQATG